MNPVDTISIECPVCGKRTRNDIPRYGGAQTYLHDPGDGHRDCRLIVVPDPQGHDHWIERVPPDREMVDFLEGLLLNTEDVRSRHRQLLAQGIQAVA